MVQKNVCGFGELWCLAFIGFGVEFEFVGGLCFGAVDPFVSLAFLGFGVLDIGLLLNFGR